MSKSNREIIRQRRRRQEMNKRLGIIGLVVVGAVLLGVALISLAGGLSGGGTGGKVAVTPITPRTFSVPVNGTSVGNPDATVKLDVWEDFQCSGCLAYTQRVEPDIIKNYVETGKVLYTFHPYPFIDGGQGESQQSTNGALCAGEQGRFWDFHDMLFANWLGENLGSYTNAKVKAFAEYLGLDMTAFNKCYASNKFAAQIAQDMQSVQGQVPPTPGIFVNGKMILNSTDQRLIPSVEDLSNAIEAALAGNK
jgi:protein-disulfide isomerase